VTHFLESVSLSKDVFMTRWKGLEGGGNEIQEVFKSCVTPLTASVVGAIKTNVLPNLHIGLVDNIDSDITMTGVGTFRTGTMGGDGQPLVVGVMMRIEADIAGGRFRCTIRSAQGTVAKGMLLAIKSQLAAY